MQVQLIKQECLEKDNQRHSLEPRKWEQSFLCVTCCPNLKNIPIQLHEDIPNNYGVMVQMNI